jgi:hypothetical protein
MSLLRMMTKAGQTMRTLQSIIKVYSFKEYFGGILPLINCD